MNAYRVFSKIIPLSGLVPLIASPTVYSHCRPWHPNHCPPDSPWSQPTAPEAVIVEPNIIISPPHGSPAKKYCRRTNDSLLVRFKNIGNGDLIRKEPAVEVYFNVGREKVKVTHRWPTIKAGRSVDLSFLTPAGCFNHDCSFTIKWENKAANRFCFG